MVKDLNEKLYSDKELFMYKDSPEAVNKANVWVKTHVPDYWEARKEQNFERSFRLLCENMEIALDNGRFVYFLDFNFRFSSEISNLTPAYEFIVKNGLSSMKYLPDECTNEFCQEYNSVLDSLILLADRVISALNEKKPDQYQQKIRWFQNIKKCGASSFEEALQRILFLNQMLWQTGSRLVGLGRLDMLLYSYYQKERIEDKQGEAILEDFMCRLHEHYWFKSNVLLGDTGQVILLGGSDKEGNYFRNSLTDMILAVIEKLHLSDPKVVLRVNKNIPKDLMKKALQCMMTGIGSPLLSNDDVIIPKLTGFGVEEEDALAYTTSACWEPLVGGKSSSMNNEERLSYMRALNNLLIEEKLSHLVDFTLFKRCYLSYLKREIKYVERSLYIRKYQKNILYSIFIDGCRKSKKDIVLGGAKYHHVGMTTVALGNTVNALLNIKKYVYEEHRYNLVDAKKICIFDYQDYPEAEEILKINDDQYGVDREEVISLTREILSFVTENTKDFRLKNGGRLKFGVSNPSYLMEGCCAPASFDGRRKGASFIVHISNENVSSYTELIHFAAALDYGENRFNGNVVDFLVTPNFVRQNFEKFMHMLYCGIEMGFFQLQMNVISSDILLEAKKKPEDFPNLIVRVWGFSAYFVELPEDYQDVLIERALRNEGKS